jgi:hypothetical protein
MFFLRMNTLPTYFPCQPTTLTINCIDKCSKTSYQIRIRGKTPLHYMCLLSLVTGDSSCWEYIRWDVLVTTLKQSKCTGCCLRPHAAESCNQCTVISVKSQEHLNGCTPIRAVVTRHVCSKRICVARRDIINLYNTEAWLTQNTNNLVRSDFIQLSVNYKNYS